FSFEGDFKDIFEVRGIVRQRRGKMNEPEIIGKDTMRITYAGLDNEERTAWIRFTADMNWDAQSATRKITLPPGQREEISYSIQCTSRQSVEPLLNYEEASGQGFANIRKKKNFIADISTSNEQFTHWIDRSKKDLISLLAETEHGYYPYAGVPWYNTIFGRDGIITAMQTLWVAPEIARGVLLYLAANQASKSDPFRDAEPGKILHEARGGEMAALDELPFRQYYGTIDATPLFVALAGHYYKRTADNETIMKIWPNIERAIRWIEEYGDVDK